MNDNLSGSTRVRFPSPMRVLTWLRGQAWLRSVYRLAPHFLRARINELVRARLKAKLSFKRTPAWNSEMDAGRAAESLVVASPVAPVIGVDIFGFVRGQFGLGESLRMYSRALIASGCDVSLHDVDLGLQHGWGDLSLDAYIRDEVSHQVCIIFINPDCFVAALDKIRLERLSGRYVIGFWFWELERIPESWLAALKHVDALMVASEFVELAFRRVTDKPIFRVPMPLPMVPDSGLQRSDFGLDQDAFIFLISFDFNSHVTRKNPFAGIAAFREAFPLDRDDVALVIKSSNGSWHENDVQLILSCIEGDRRIIFRDEIIDRAHVGALQRCCDAYVSLHRAEGFGLGLVECMALGKPVIATGWSGNLEYMSSENSLLVDYRLVPVRGDEYPESAGSLWAEADVSSAAAAMQKLADSPQLACEIGRRARDYVHNKLSLANTVGCMVAQLESIATVSSGVRSPSRTKA